MAKDKRFAGFEKLATKGLGEEKARDLPWLIVSHKLYKLYEPEGAEDGRLRGTLCAEVGISGWVAGHYRWNITGVEIMRISVPLADIMDWNGASEFHLSWEIRPEDIRLRDNASSGDWEDLGDLVARSRVIVTRGEEDDSHEFLGKSI